MSEDSAAIARAQRAIDRHVRLVPDFPEPGIAFKDLTPVLADPEGLSAVVQALAECCEGAEVIAGLDARGFLIGGAVAAQLGVGVVAVRKGGKLPPPVIGIDYDLEYGSARLEVPAEGIELAGRRVAVVDDVLATGGTAVASGTLLRKAGAEVTTVAVIMELADMDGRGVVAEGLGDSVVVRNLCEG